MQRFEISIIRNIPEIYRLLIRNLSIIRNILEIYRLLVPNLSIIKFHASPTCLSYLILCCNMRNCLNPDVSGNLYAEWPHIKFGSKTKVPVKRVDTPLWILQHDWLKSSHVTWLTASNWTIWSAEWTPLFAGQERATLLQTVKRSPRGADAYHLHSNRRSSVSEVRGLVQTTTWSFHHHPRQGTYLRHPQKLARQERAYSSRFTAFSLYLYTPHSHCILAFSGEFSPHALFKNL